MNLSDVIFPIVLNNQIALNDEKYSMNMWSLVLHSEKFVQNDGFG